MTNILYPEGKRKALTFSYDDGPIHDRRLVALFNQHGIKGTFHLNSGKLDTPDFVSAQEVPTLYAGHEVSCHGVNHDFLTQLSTNALIFELYQDRRALEALCDDFICGMSYAFGEYSNAVIQCAKTVGIEYARTTKSTRKFLPPTEFLEWHPTCHHKEAFNEPNLIEDFLHSRAFIQPSLLYIWGHSYEFERAGNWQQIEALCAELAGHEEIWYATNAQIYRYLSAARSLVYSADNSKIYNPTNTTVWLEQDGRVFSV